MPKLKAAFDELISWIVSSSANPQVASLTLKGALLGSVPAIMYVVGVAHLNLGQDQLTMIFDGVVGFFQAVLAVVSTGIVLFGALRKVWLTLFPPKG